MMLNDILRSINELPDNSFGIIILILAVIALVTLAAAFIFLKRTRLIEDTPTSKVRSAAQGYVELEGTQYNMEASPLLSPLGNTPCTWYRYEIAEYRKNSNDKGGTWATIEQGVSSELFRLKDETGECFIDPEDAMVLTKNAQIWYGPERYPASNKTSFWLRKRYRYTEWCLRPHTYIYALGGFHSIGNTPSQSEAKTAVALLIGQWKKDYQTLLEKFDTNKDGVLDLKEWAAVEKAAEAEIRKQNVKKGAHPDVHMLSKHGIMQQPFILSEIPQAKLIKRSRLKAGACLLGFIIFAGVALFLISNRP